MAEALFVSGLALVALAVAFLAGAWWGVLVAGVVLAGLGVLTRMGADSTAPAPSGEGR
ncbi:hypothetical protein ACTHAM_002364 [Cellulomonas soli]|uniref:hypothetical protein n=1 Tax=Cellulomonas soli TaxID=931535 RepID=UPI003F8789B2